MLLDALSLYLNVALISPDNVLFMHKNDKIGLILEIPINRPKVLLLFAYRTITILSISVLDCCRLIIDWRHLCKTLFFKFLSTGRTGSGFNYAGPGHEISARALVYVGDIHPQSR